MQDPSDSHNKICSKEPGFQLKHFYEFKLYSYIHYDYIIFYVVSHIHIYICDTYIMKLLCEIIIMHHMLFAFCHSNSYCFLMEF